MPSSTDDGLSKKPAGRGGAFAHRANLMTVGEQTVSRCALGFARRETIPLLVCGLASLQ